MYRDREKRILAHWEKDDIESMYDKYLLRAEINLIRKQITRNSLLLDAGCGEGESTLEYSKISGVSIHAVDFSETRLRKARQRLKNRKNVTLAKIDLSNIDSFEHKYDIIISQRFLINLPDWRSQSEVINRFTGALKPSGKLILLEGSKQGVDSLNRFRKVWGLRPIPIQWYNVFLNDTILVRHMLESGYTLSCHDGLGAYFLLTRGIRPNLDLKLNWDCQFNKVAASKPIRELMGISTDFSRLKLWVFQNYLK